MSILDFLYNRERRFLRAHTDAGGMSGNAVDIAGVERSQEAKEADRPISLKTFISAGLGAGAFLNKELGKILKPE